MKRSDFFRSLAALVLIPVLPKPKPQIEGRGIFQFVSYDYIRPHTPRVLTIDKLEAEFHKQVKSWQEKHFSDTHDLLMKRFKRLDNEKKRFF